VEQCLKNTDATIFLDEVRRLHEAYDSLAARVSKVEEKSKGSKVGGMMDDVLMYFAIAYIASLLLPPLISMWNGKPCDQQQ
jgi:hypothetical protein